MSKRSRYIAELGKKQMTQDKTDKSEENVHLEIDTQSAQHMMRVDKEEHGEGTNFISDKEVQVKVDQNIVQSEVSENDDPMERLAGKMFKRSKYTAKLAKYQIESGEKNKSTGKMLRIVHENVQHVERVDEIHGEQLSCIEDEVQTQVDQNIGCTAVIENKVEIEGNKSQVSSNTESIVVQENVAKVDELLGEQSSSINDEVQTKVGHDIGYPAAIENDVEMEGNKSQF